MAASGNGEPYDGKLRILHHYVDNFTCEGRSQPESILIRENEAGWYLIRNTSDKCAFIDRDPVQGVQYDEVANQAVFNNQLYVPPHPYYVDAKEDPNLSDVRLEDGVCEDKNGICSLRASIDQAGATSMTEAVLVHIPDGLYNVTETMTLKGQASQGNAVTLRGQNPLTTILDGNNSVIPLTITLTNRAPVFVENLTIQNGRSNQIYQGSAIDSARYPFGSPVVATNCIFKNNKGNAAIHGHPGSGPIQIRKSQFIGNEGAIHAIGIQGLSVEDSTFTNGSLFGVWAFRVNNVTVKRSTFSKNFSRGIELDDCQSCLIENVTVSQNQDYGISIYASAVDGGYNVTVNNSTLTENGSNITNGGNLLVEFTDSINNKLIVNNSILAMNDVLKKNCHWNASGTQTGHRIIATNSLFDDSSCEQLGSGNILADPQLGPLADNGGFTPTRLPLPGSPLVDAGANNLCSKEDQRGLPRPINSSTGPRCDMGSVER